MLRVRAQLVAVVLTQQERLRSRDQRQPGILFVLHVLQWRRRVQWQQRCDKRGWRQRRLG